MAMISLPTGEIVPKFGRALTWWGDGLRAALPRWLISLVVGDQRCIHLGLDSENRLRAELKPSPFADEVLAAATFEDGVQPSGASRKIVAAARSLPVILQAPDNLILTQTVTLPLAALEDLSQAVRFGLSSWTPFAADDVLVQTSVVERRAEQARVRLRLVTRAALGPALDAAKAHGFVVRAIGFGTESADYSEIGQKPPKRTASPGRIDAAMGLSALVLAVALLVGVQLKWTAELEDLQAQVRTEIAHRSQQAKLEAELAQLEGQRRAVLTKRAAELRISSVVGELAERLPENAEITEFTWTGDRGRVTLSSASGADIAAALEPSTFLQGTIGPRRSSGSIDIDLALKPASR